MLAALCAVLLAACADGVVAPSASAPSHSPTLTLASQSARAVLFGPQRFTRQTGAPTTESVVVAGSNFASFKGPFVLTVQNGAEQNSTSRVTSAWIWLDGVLLYGPGDFSPTAGTLQREVTLRPGSVLTVRLAGAPGSFITVRIEGTLVAGAFVVNSTVDATDAVPGDGVCETAEGRGICTLRAAIQESNALPGPDLITLPAGTYPLTLVSGSFGPTGAEAGDLNVTDALTITGAGPAVTAIDCAGPGVCAAPQGGIFRISAAPVVITDVSLTHTRSDPALGGNGAVLVDPGASLRLQRVVIRDQHSGISGGAISNAGTLTLDRVTVDGNTARDYGGGLVNSGSATITNSTFSDNDAWLGGGAIGNFGGTLTIANSTLSGNTVTGRISPDLGPGAAILNRGTGGRVVLNAVTITGNVAGGSDAAVQNDAGAVLELGNTIVAGNTAATFPSPTPADCRGTLTSLGYNLIQSTTGCTVVGTLAGNLLGVDPLLGPLAANGGPTATHALLTGSPAIDAGNPAPLGSGPAACPATDQRGAPRLGRCDIGAYEAGAVPP